MEFQVPLLLSQFKEQPLLVKVVVLRNFPLQAPILIMVSKFFVHKDINPNDYLYQGAGIKEWSTKSNLVHLLQRITKEFDAEPPIPMSLLQPDKDKKPCNPTLIRSHQQQLKSSKDQVETIIPASHIKDLADKVAGQSRLLSQVETERLTNDSQERMRRVQIHPDFVNLCQKCDKIEENTYMAAKKIIEQAQNGSDQVYGDEYKEKIQQL